jgi:hypothetical protein
VDQVSGTAQALLALKDGTGKRAVLAVDPGQKLWRFGVSAAGNAIAWDGPARRFGDDSAESAQEEAELRVVGGEVAVVVADEELPLDDPPALSPPFEAELGVAVEDGAQGSGWVRFDSVRAHAVAVAAPVSGPVPGAELLASEAFDGEPRTVPYDNPALSGWVNDGALVLRSTTNRTWPTYPTGIEVGPVAAASVVVALGEASGEGIPVLLLRGGEGQQARFDLDLDELRLRYGHSAGAGKRVTFGNWRVLSGGLGSVETAEIRIVGGEAALLLDGATAVSGLALSPGFTDGPFSVVLGAYHHQTSRPVDFAVAFGDVAVYRLPPGSPLPSPAASPGAAPTVPHVPTPVPTPAPTPAMPDGDLVDENAFGGPRRSLTWADDPAFAAARGTAPFGWPRRPPTADPHPGPGGRPGRGWDRRRRRGHRDCRLRRRRAPDRRRGRRPIPPPRRCPAGPVALRGRPRQRRGRRRRAVADALEPVPAAPLDRASDPGGTGWISGSTDNR